MSRIGKAPVVVPEKVEVKVEKNNLVTVKGPNGELQQKIHPDITIEIKDNEVLLSRPTEQKRHRAFHGLYRALIANMVEGVSKGFEKKLELVGVGYKASNQGQLLDLVVGFSHEVIFEVPKEISVETVTEKGKNPAIILKSHDKQLLGLVASKIRSIRKPEPYKGKGIKYADEYIRRKAGKAAGK